MTAHPEVEHLVVQRAIRRTTLRSPLPRAPSAGARATFRALLHQRRAIASAEIGLADLRVFFIQPVVHPAEGKKLLRSVGPPIKPERPGEQLSLPLETHAARWICPGAPCSSEDRRSSACGMTVIPPYVTRRDRPAHAVRGLALLGGDGDARRGESVRPGRATIRTFGTASKPCEPSITCARGWLFPRMEPANSVPHPLLAYISCGRLHLESEDGGEILESAFGCSLRDRTIQIHNRNAWKLQGRGGQSLSRALHMPPEREPGSFRIAISSVSRGLNPGELLYTLETDEISGVFFRDSAGVERRLFHTADFRARHVDPHPDGGEVALSTFHADGTANLAVLRTDGSGLTEVTDGDSVDQAPRWVPGPGRRLVFQSAGVARDSGARLSGYGPSAVQQLDLDTGAISCLAQDANFDFLWPRIGSDGTLYYIRRPSANAPKQVDPWAALHQTVLLPFRILWVIARFVEVFIDRRTGQPLSTGKGISEKAIQTPSSWLLMRQKAGEEVETIAESARSFDLAGDGSLVYSNGFDVYRISANGGRAAKILSGPSIDLIAAL